jgi:hypothetical protein
MGAPEVRERGDETEDRRRRDGGETAAGVEKRFHCCARVAEAGRVGLAGKRAVMGGRAAWRWVNVVIWAMRRTLLY